MESLGTTMRQSARSSILHPTEEMLMEHSPLTAFENISFFLAFMKHAGVAMSIF
jgi:hypothetical protein